jgi:hypothetical protein
MNEPEPPLHESRWKMLLLTREDLEYTVFLRPRRFGGPQPVISPS